MVAGNSISQEEPRVSVGTAAEPAKTPGQGHSIGLLPQLPAVTPWCFRQRNETTEPRHPLGSQNSPPVALGVSEGAHYL